MLSFSGRQQLAESVSNFAANVVADYNNGTIGSKLGGPAVDAVLTLTPFVPGLSELGGGNDVIPPTSFALSDTPESNTFELVQSPEAELTGAGSRQAAPPIDWGQQGKHIVGNNNYIPGRSILQADPEYLANWAGTGEPVNSVAEGQPGYRERVDFGFIIGKYIDVTGTSQDTTVGIIHYSKTGIHIVPARPSGP